MKTLEVTIDRPMGYVHHGTVYPLNYGYVAGQMGGDGEAQDVYVISRKPEFQQPLTTFSGQLIAVIHRRDDVEDKWVVTSPGEHFRAEEISTQVDFMECYFDSWVELVE